MAKKPFVTTGFLLKRLSEGTIFTLKKRTWRIENILVKTEQRTDLPFDQRPRVYECAPKMGGVFQTQKNMLTTFNEDTDVVIAEGYPEI